MTLVSLDLIKQRLAADVDQLVPQLYPNARLDGPHWRLGSVHGEPGQSLAINRGGKWQGCWTDFSSGERGTVLDLVAVALCGGDIREAVKRGRELAGLGYVTPDEVRQRERQADMARARADRAEAERREKIAASTQRIFYFECEALAGSPSERYLAGRGIRLAELGRFPSALRHHPGLLHPDTGRAHPCLVALVLDADGQPMGIHRTFLQVEPDGRVIKLQGVSAAKLSLGPVKGGHVPLWRGASNKPTKHMPAGEWILLTEGIEDGLSAAYECPDMRIWAGVSLANMGGLQLPAACGGVWWHRHRDSDTATRAAEAAIARLAGSGVTIRDIWAPGSFKDFNEARQAADLARFAKLGEIGPFSPSGRDAPSGDSEMKTA
jgi:hypothetical protein